MTAVRALVRARHAASLALVSVLLASCVSPRAPALVATSAPAHGPATSAGTGANALAAGISAGPDTSRLPIDPSRAPAALAAFRTSCAALVKRTDRSLLTRGADWRPACDAAPAWRDGDAATFFARYFETVRVGDGHLFATGYYEPVMDGSRDPQLDYDVPVYRVPDDMVEADLGKFAPDLQGRKIKGRVQNGKLVPYPDRGQIEDGALKGRGLEIAWVKDPVALFFLQIQGSGRLTLPDGTVLRLGYAGQNGRSYVGIGKLMKDRGLLAPGQSTMQGIVAWLHDHPADGDALMRENGSYVFFKELTGPGPLGALGVPVVGHVSLAADPAFAPLGAPVWLEADRAQAAGLWIAQDTGGAIKGPNRFDTFWGHGRDAPVIAGGMSAHGFAYLLLPTGTLARLQHDGQTARP